MLESRIITDDHPYYSHDPLHAYPRNCHVDDKNKLKLQEFAPEREHEIINPLYAKFAHACTTRNNEINFGWSEILEPRD